MEIVAGVHLVPGTKGSNVYLLTGEHMVLVDTGLPGNAAAITGFIRELGREPTELSLIVVTHGHIDHVGSLTAVQALTGAPVAAHRDETTPSASGDRELWPNRASSSSWPMRLMSRVMGHTATAVAVPIDRDQVLPMSGGLRAVSTPGHTRGSICLLLDRGGVLFAGDTIINNVDRLSRPLPFGGAGLQSEESLRKIAALNFDVCCFGHGPPLHGASDRVKALALRRSRAPLYWRMARSWRRLLGFPTRLDRGE